MFSSMSGAGESLGKESNLFGMFFTLGFFAEVTLDHRETCKLHAERPGRSELPLLSTEQCHMRESNP